MHSRHVPVRPPESRTTDLNQHSYSMLHQSADTIPRDKPPAHGGATRPRATNVQDNIALVAVIVQFALKGWACNT
jgi:hypothetical protein